MNTISVALAFTQAGERIHLVGGCVRDQLIGVPVKDWDFATSALPPKSKAILSPFGSVYSVGEKFGTIGVLLLSGERFEVTTYRGESYLDGTRKPDVTFGQSLEDDLARRDFTINAMAQDPLSGQIIDPFNGRRDLEYRIIRAVGNPRERFSEDPLRMFRAVRFAARLYAQIEFHTECAIHYSFDEVARLSQERIRDELDLIVTGRVAAGMWLLRHTGLLFRAIPEMRLLLDERTQGAYHRLCLWDHTLAVADAVPATSRLRWTALLHDVGKSQTRTQPDVAVHYFGHEDVGADIANTLLSRLRFPLSFTREVTTLIREHMRLNGYQIGDSNRSIRRLKVALRGLEADAIALAMADAESHVGRDSRPLLDLAERLSEAPAIVEMVRCPLSGEDLMERYGRGPGPWIKPIKTHLQEMVIDGELDPNDRDRAMDIADALYREAGAVPA